MLNMVRPNTRSEDVLRWRRRTKQRLVLHLGGKCSRCGWTGNNAGFDFHHLGDKDFGVSQAMSHPKKYELLLSEVEKCVLLCATCHRLEHSGPEYDPDRDGPLERPTPEPWRCTNCANEVSYGSERCVTCRNEQQTIGKWPNTFEELQNDVANLGYTGAGRKYGVSDNAVRKRLKRLC